jgi:hypothetical protein
VHAQIAYDTPELSVAAIRDAKIDALRELFEKERGSSHFEAFCRTYRWIQSACKTEFGRWVQFFLFGQLGQAYERILNLGMQLVVDLTPSGPLHEFFEPLQMWSRYAQAIHLIGLDLYCDPVRREVIESLIGAKHTEFIVRTFCEQRGDTLHIPERCRTPAYLEQVRAQMGDQALAGEFRRRLEYLFGFVSNADQAKYRDYLRRIAPLLPAALIIDSTATAFFGAQAVAMEFDAIPAGSGLVQGIPIALMPARLAPDLVSEFVQPVPSEQVLEQIRERAASPDALSVTVYLCDLLSAIGLYDRHPPPPIQLISGDCRFSLPMSLAELRQEHRATSQISEFLTACQRAI